MLTCYGHECRLPRNDLTYIVFGLAALNTISKLDFWMLDEPLPNEECLQGFLCRVPILRPTPPWIQVDLLAEVWVKQNSETLIQANILDAAVTYAGFHEAQGVIRFDARAVQRAADHGPQKINRILNLDTVEALEVQLNTFLGR